MGIRHTSHAKRQASAAKENANTTAMIPVTTYDPDPVVGDVASPTGGLVFEC